MNNRILIVDDQKIHWSIAKNILKNIHKNIDTAENGEIAVNMINNNPNYVIILMDINMPIMDGRQATEKIKQTNPEIKIYCTTSDDTLIEEVKKNKNFDGMILKPFSRDKLCNTIVF